MEKKGTLNRENKTELKRRGMKGGNNNKGGKEGNDNNVRGSTGD